MAEFTAQDLERVAEEVSRRTVRHTLTTLGFDTTQPLEVQRDMAALRELRHMMQDEEFRQDLVYLRSWRSSMQGARSRGFMAVVTLAMAGLGAALWAGITTYFQKGS